MIYRHIASSNKKEPLVKWASQVFVEGTYIIAKDMHDGYWNLRVENNEAIWWLNQDPHEEPKRSELELWNKVGIWSGSLHHTGGVVS